MDKLTSLVASCLATSYDRGDQHTSQTGKPFEAAQTFLADALNSFQYLPWWWHIATDAAKQPVGFVLPVMFMNSQQNGRDEGTIYHLGVLPEQRGQHYSHDMLCFATALLQTIGVWRIFCDTDAQNVPMIRTFRAVGYIQAGMPYERSL
jgi:ribosomal protein S18 acetylase RimI-like enzyme